jgi:archaellum component FlaG (FlaF/FlaG flagellin family)
MATSEQAVQQAAHSLVPSVPSNTADTGAGDNASYTYYLKNTSSKKNCIRLLITGNMEMRTQLTAAESQPHMKISGKLPVWLSDQLV